MKNFIIKPFKVITIFIGLIVSLCFFGKIYADSSLTVKVGENQKIVFNNANFVAVNTAIATVNSTGNVRGVCPGTTKIHVYDKKDGHYLDTYYVKVTFDLKTSQNVNKITKGSQIIITPDVPLGKASNIIWSSSNTNVAKVSKSSANDGGIVNAVGAGRSQITADINGVKAYMDITVVESTKDKTTSTASTSTASTTTDSTQEITYEEIGDFEIEFARNGYVDNIKLGETCVADVAKKILLSTGNVGYKNYTEGTIEWSIDDDSIASIDKDGLIVSKQVGSTTVHAKLSTGEELVRKIIILDNKTKTATSSSNKTSSDGPTELISTQILNMIRKIVKAIIDKIMSILGI